MGDPLTFTISRRALLIAIGTVGFVLSVAAISWTTNQITGDAGYVDCFREANEKSLAAYEEYVNTPANSASDAAAKQADFIRFENEYIRDVRDC